MTIMPTVETGSENVFRLQPSRLVGFICFLQIKQIRVYKNGDEHDPGKLITVARREYKHWVIFLDALTRKLGTTTAVHKLYSIHGNKVHHFAELENNGEYVAVERGPFIDCNYGAHRVRTQVEKKWTSLVRVTESKPIFLSSGDSMDIYLKKEGYGSTTCLPYPLDGLSKSPTLSNFYLGGLSTQKCFGSLERLNKTQKDIWSEDSDAMGVATIRSGEIKEEGLTKGHSMSITRLPRLPGIEDASRKSANQKPALRVKEDDRLPSIKKETDLSVKEVKGGSTKRDMPDVLRCSTRDLVCQNRLREAEGKEIDEKEDVMEYAVVDKPLLPWDNGGGTVYEKKETMREVIIEDSKPGFWLESLKRGEKKTTKVVRTYEKFQEYTRSTDDFDPDLVD